MDDHLAFRVIGLLSNGAGGIDWSGMPLVCGALGVRDVQGLLHRIEVIKRHSSRKD